MPRAAPPAERLEQELDPESKQYRLLFGPEPEDTKDWIEAFLTIPNPAGQVVDFRLYPQQVMMLQEHCGRDVTIKGRQTRASSLILARNLRRLTTSFGLNALIMTQDELTTLTFRTRLLHHLNDLRAKGLDYPVPVDSKGEMVIGDRMQNHITFGSGEQRVQGRAYSAQIFHGSEVPHWRPETASELIGGITPSVPGAPDGWMDLESTPNGAEGIFYDYARDAHDNPDDPLNPWRVHFYPWWLEPRYKAGSDAGCDLRLDKYTLADLLGSFRPTPVEERLMSLHGLSVEQILWRRSAEREQAKTGTPFSQEYVEDFSSCFVTGEDNFFSSPDGKDHLAFYRDRGSDPPLRLDKLPYRGADVSFFGPNLSVWEMPDAKSTYVGYLDSAEGGTGRDHDYSALAVVNVNTRHHAASLRIKSAPGDVGTMSCAVMAFYNHGFLAGERGSYGTAALERVKELNYSNIYYHHDPKKKGPPEPWIYPTQQNRDDILRVLREGVFDRSFDTRDRALVSEMGTFDWKKVAGKVRHKARARKRRHDDLVIAAAGALYVAVRVFRYTSPRGDEMTAPQRTLVVGRAGQVLDPVPSGRMPWLV